MDNAPGEEPAPERKPDASTPVTASGEDSVAAGRDINAPVFTGDIRNSVIRIYTAGSRWLQNQVRANLIVSGLTLLVGVVILVLLVKLFAWPAPSPIPPLLPDPNKLARVDPPAASFAITALSAEADALWIGAESEGGSALYRLDVTSYHGAGTLTKSLPVLMDNFQNSITGLAVDCKGNVWVLLFNEGARVFQPETRRHSALFDQNSTHGWLSKDTSTAIATRCTDKGDPQVWLGNEGVHTLEYAGAYPEEGTIRLAPPQQDWVWQETRKYQLNNVKAMQYVTQTQSLWVADNYGQLLSISVAGTRETARTDWRPTFLWALSGAPNQTVWVGSTDFIAPDGDKTRQIPLVASGDAAGKPLARGAEAVAAGKQWIWFGARCGEQQSDCWSLGVSAPPALSRVGLNARQVRALAVDRAGVLWIGTENGLFYYPEP